MCYKIGYELPAILIVGILRTALLKKVLDTFLPAEGKNRFLWKLVFAGYYLLTTAAYGVFHLTLFYEICNLTGIIGAACFYRGPWEKKIWIAMVYFCLDMGSGAAVSFAGSELIRMQEGAVSALQLSMESLQKLKNELLYEAAVLCLCLYPAVVKHTCL